MQAHLNGHAHTSSHVGKAGRVSPSRGLTHGHDAEGLHGGERGGFVFEEQPPSLVEEVVASGSEVVRVGPPGRLVGEVAGIGKKGIDQQGAAVLVAAAPEVLVEALAREDDVEGVGPAEIQVQQAFDEAEVVGDGGPGGRPGFCHGARHDGGVVFVLGNERQAAGVAKVSALARAGHGRLPEHHGELALQRLGHEGGGGGRQGDGLAPGVLQGKTVALVGADVVDQLIEVGVGQCADGGEQEVGGVGGGRGRGRACRGRGSACRGLRVSRGGGGRGSGDCGIALGACLCLGAAVLAVGVVVAGRLVHGDAGRTVGGPAIALQPSASPFTLQPKRRVGQARADSGTRTRAACVVPRSTYLTLSPSARHTG